MGKKVCVRRYTEKWFTETIPQKYQDLHRPCICSFQTLWNVHKNGTQENFCHFLRYQKVHNSPSFQRAFPISENSPFLLYN
ncbi:hypothetical protein SAMN00777080_1216 [Aquiflexum balticum DSM 16537]|uniref:Uncharacterized protein n=1 Tax=Aquiflexum balticum DSM 16537 TaxID=758820 RepID=A0A1W2H133_9BACT|nr:hypothetical protein SAMN00777080_1216 [Aquiflexum balticum DSM 16537]